MKIVVQCIQPIVAIVLLAAAVAAQGTFVKQGEHEGAGIYCLFVGRNPCPEGNDSHLWPRSEVSTTLVVVIS